MKSMTAFLAIGLSFCGVFCPLLSGSTDDLIEQDFYFAFRNAIHLSESRSAHLSKFGYVIPYFPNPPKCQCNLHEF